MCCRYAMTRGNDSGITSAISLPRHADRTDGDFDLGVAVPQQLRHDLPVLDDVEVETVFHRQAAGLVSLQEPEAEPRRGAAVGEPGRAGRKPIDASNNVSCCFTQLGDSSDRGKSLVSEKLFIRYFSVYKPPSWCYT